MNFYKKLSSAFILCFSIFSLQLVAQQKSYTIANAHAHNDYLHLIPFHMAFDAGFGSIEADVYPINGILMVSHNKKDIKPELTLAALYIEPLLNELSKNSSRKLKLLIDVKEKYAVALQLLLKEIEPLKNYLYSPEQTDNPVTILISGERPPPAEYNNYPGYIFFDDDLRLKHNEQEWKRVGQVSLSFERYSDWQGVNSPEDKDKKILQQLVDSVHDTGKTIRFWAAPDTEDSWKLQKELGVDLIGTDEIDELAEFLKKMP